MKKFTNKIMTTEETATRIIRLDSIYSEIQRLKDHVSANTAEYEKTGWESCWERAERFTRLIDTLREEYSKIETEMNNVGQEKSA